MSRRSPPRHPRSGSGPAEPPARATLASSFHLPAASDFIRILSAENARPLPRPIRLSGGECQVAHRVGRFHSFQGDAHEKRGPSAGLRAEAQSPREILQDLPADEQTEPRAMGLGGEERLEQPATIRDRDSSTIIFNRKDEPGALDPSRQWIRPWSSVASIAFKTRLRTT